MSEELSYNGISIKVNGAGKFVAKVGTQVIASASFAGLKKKLSALQTFPTFEAWARYYYGYQKVTVVALKRNNRRGYSNGAAVFVTDKGDTLNVAIPSTPENDALVAEHKVLEEQYAQVRKELDDKLHALKLRMTRRRAVDEVQG